MYWMVFLLIFLGITVAFIILQRYTQNKTLWITDMSAVIWFSVPPHQFELIKKLIDEYNRTLPKSTGVVVVGVNFESESMLIERLEDSFYTFSSVQVPDMIFLSERSLEKLYKKKFVLSADKDDATFKMFPMMASMDMMYVNMKRFDSMKKYIQKNPELPELDDSILSTLEGIEKAADVYTRIQIEENLLKNDGVKPFVTINSLNKFFITVYMQLGGECKTLQRDYDAFYKVWKFIVKGILLGYIAVIPEKKQFFNKMDTVKSPVAIGYYTKESYRMSEYPCFEGSGKVIVPLTKYGMAFVTKRMHDTKKSVLTYFGDWLIQQSKNSEIAVFCNCLPIVNGSVSTDKEPLQDAISQFALDVDIEEDTVEKLNQRSDLIVSVYTHADEVIDYNQFDDEHVEKIVSKILDYTDACRVKLDNAIDYENPDSDVVGNMYARKAFDNWVNFFDL